MEEEGQPDAPKKWAFKTTANCELHAISCEAETPRAIFVFHHGYGEHIGRYTAFFKLLSRQGIHVHGYDMQHFGQSCAVEKDRGKLASFHTAVDTLLEFCDKIHDHHTQRESAGKHKLPFFLGGQSAGALLAACAVAKEQSAFSGLVMLSPAIGVDMNLVLHVQSLLAGPLTMAVPWGRMVPAVKPEDLNDDPEEVRAYVEDPLNFVGPMRVKTAAELKAAMGWLDARAPTIGIPVIGLHGEMDKTTSLRAHQAFMEKISSKDKTLKVVEGGMHELLFTGRRQEHMLCVADWIFEHIS